MSGLPTNWSKVTLGDVITGFEAGRNLRASSSPASESEFGVLKISAVSWGKFQPQENKALLPGDRPMPRELVRTGDLLISRANTTELVGAPVLVDRDYNNLMLPDKILRVKYNERIVDPRYLLYALRTKEARTYIEEQATGTSDSMRNLSQPKLSAVPIPLAPLVEQKRIADKLDRLLAAVDTCKARLDAIPATLKRFRQSVLVAATLGELTREWRQVRPSEWCRLSLADVSDVISGFAFKKDSYSESGHRLLQIANVGYGRTRWDVQAFLPGQLANEFKELALSPDDVVMALNRPITNGELKVARISKEDLPAILYQRVARLRAKAALLDASYLLLCVRSPDFQRQVADNLQGSDQPYLNTSALSKLMIPVPTLEEQLAIVQRADGLLAGAKQVEQKLVSTRERIDRLIEALLSMVFRGELVTRQSYSNRVCSSCSL